MRTKKEIHNTRLMTNTNIYILYIIKYKSRYNLQKKVLIIEK